MDQEQLRQIVIASGKPKLLRVMRVIERIIEEEAAGFEHL